MTDIENSEESAQTPAAVGGPGATAPPVFVPAPSNNFATASIVVACSSIALLVLTAGIFAPITLVSSSIATFLGHRGKSDVDHGKTTVQRDLAVAGFWTAIGGIILSVLALIAWVVILVLIITDDSFDWDSWNGEGGF
jgi:heme/copper-type cytochrome/quinol oxidase subunit 2